MINRILIRIKVVQMLYSFMLTRSDFRIAPAPEKSTRDNRFAYLTYIRTLLLILKLSGQKTVPADSLSVADGADKRGRLRQSKIASSLQSNSDLREAASKLGIAPDAFDTFAQELHDKVVGSAVFGEYSRKRSREIADDVNLWTVVIESILAKDAVLEAEARNLPDFTIKGYRAGIEMALDTLREYTDDRMVLSIARKNLANSLDQAYLLYHALLRLPVEITRLRAEQVESAKEKYLPTADELNPNLRFIDNAFVASIADSHEMEAYFKENPFSWETDYYLIRDLLDAILSSPIYENYMAAPTTNYEADCEFWRTVLKDIILPSDNLAEALEAKSVYWNDDINVIGTFVLKTVRRAAGAGNIEEALLPKFKDEEDEQFGDKLFADAIVHGKEYREMIDSFINKEQWDTERIALMDIVIMTTAIAELLTFPSIPVAVTLNEYIEIANYYSTPRSGQFVNGILYSVMNRLRGEGRLLKPIDSKAE